MNMIDNGFSIVWLSLAQTQAQPEAGATAAPVQQAPRVPGSVGAQNAQTTGTTGATPAGPAGPPPASSGSPFNMIWILMLFLVVMVVMTSMTGRREKKRRESLMSALKKGDRVQTLGGIIGTIIELQDNEVVLRVDEVSNTRIRFARSAVQGVIREGKPLPGSGGAGGGTEVEPKLKSQTAAV